MSSNEDRKYREAIELSLRFCGYRERSIKEINTKLQLKNYTPQLIEKVIKRLEEIGAVDNSRFAKAFSRGKNKSNRWGRVKIRNHLFEKGLNSSEIEEGINSIDEKIYYEVLRKNIEIYTRKHNKIEKNKLIAHLLYKGFSSDEILKSIEQLT